MENIIKLKSYNLVNADGWRLQLYLGMDVDVNRTYTKGKLDKGFRWSFVGTKIPMPVRAYTWFNGFPESVMLDWLKENGWALRTVVELPDGNATVYELPFVDESNKGNEKTTDWNPVGIVGFPNNGEPVVVTYLSCIDGRPCCDAVAYRSGNRWRWRDSDDLVEVIITAWKPCDEPYRV